MPQGAGTRLQNERDASGKGCRGYKGCKKRLTEHACIPARAIESSTLQLGTALWVRSALVKLFRVGVPLFPSLGEDDAAFLFSFNGICAVCRAIPWCED